MTCIGPLTLSTISRRTNPSGRYRTHEALTRRNVKKERKGLGPLAHLAEEAAPAAQWRSISSTGDASITQAWGMWGYWGEAELQA